MAKQAVIIGAGPAGLTAAAELLDRTEYKPIILELTPHIGGLSRTVVHNGNRMDIGGHRFFSKADRVMEWWFRRLPLQAVPDLEQTIFYQGGSRLVSGGPEAPDPAGTDRVMLLRHRSSRIYYRNRLFPYPIRLNLSTLLKLGFLRSFMILASYLRSKVFPPRRIENLEEFFISRFGRVLYETFFKSYTEKVWGLPCTKLSAEWGAQRIKSLSISRAILHALSSMIPWRRSARRDRVETSLIEQFLYPKLGPGQMWETVAAEVEARGGEIRRQTRAVRLVREGRRITAVETESTVTGERSRIPAELVFSTMPVRDLVRAMDPGPDSALKDVAEGLAYRDFLTVGVLLPRLKMGSVGDKGTVRDNWIYIHDPSVDAGRLQIFNNWSPWMVKDPATVWVGVEYFCSEGDRLWSQPDEAMIAQTVREMRKLGLVGDDVPLDAVVVRAPKAYPAYTGTYGRFDELRDWLDTIDNLLLIGRNGMHRYNNQDHSMLAAMIAVDNLLAGTRDRSNLWQINSEENYHETKTAPAPAASVPTSDAAPEVDEKDEAADPERMAGPVS